MSASALWNLAAMPLFTIAFFHFLFATVITRQATMVIGAVAMLACLVQFHLSTLAFGAVLVLALVIYRPPLRPRHLMLSPGALVRGLLPYSWAAIRTGGGGAEAALSFVLAYPPAGPPDDFLASIRLMFFKSTNLTAWMIRQ